MKSSSCKCHFQFLSRKCGLYLGFRYVRATGALHNSLYLLSFSVLMCKIKRVVIIITKKIKIISNTYIAIICQALFWAIHMYNSTLRTTLWGRYWYQQPSHYHHSPQHLPITPSHRGLKSQANLTSPLINTWSWSQVAPAKGLGLKI